MSKIVVDDDFLYRHMPALEEKIMRAYPKEEELAYEFSEEFERKMKKLMKRAAQKEKYGLPVSTGKRIAAAIAVGLIGIMAVSVNTKALNMEFIRTKLYEFTQTVYDTYIERRYTAPEDQVGEFVPLYPEYIPEGYELAIEEADDTSLFISYENKEGTGFAISQEQIQDGMSVSDDNEYIREEETEILGYQAKVSYKDDGRIHIRWKSDDTLYLVMTNSITEEELIKVCESLKIQ